MRTFSRHLFSALVFLGSFLLLAPATHAAQLTVCASGCTGDTISSVLTSASDGDQITVQGVGVNPSNPYDPSTEIWPIQFSHASNTLVCTGGATIGHTDTSQTGALNVTTSSTVSDCSFGSLTIGTVFELGPVANQSPHGIQILNNAFSTIATSTISFSSAGGTDFVISGNTNIQSLGFSANATNTRGTVSNNTFRNRLTYNNSGVTMLSSSASSSLITFSGNTFSNVISAIGSSDNFLELDGVNLTFATNTVLNPAQSMTYAGGGAFNVLKFYASGTQNYIGGNIIEIPTSTSAGCVGIAIQPSAIASTNGLSWSSTINVAHNTIVFGRGSSCTTDSFGISFIPTGSYTRADLTLTTLYNLIANEYGTTGGAGAINLQASSAKSTIQVSSDYNGAMGFTYVARKKIDGTNTNLTNTHDTTASPSFRTGNTDNSDNYTPAPFSSYLDVNGTQDIGAVAAARRSTIYLDDNGTIDYSSVDATSTSALSGNLRSNDTVQFASGSYAGFDVDSTNATSSLTFAGAGAASTFLIAPANSNALRLSGVTSTIISGITLSDATDSSQAYLSSYIAGRFGGVNYDEGDAGMGVSAGNTVFVNTSPCEGSFNPSMLTSDGQTIDGLDGASDIHMILIEGPTGGHITFLIPESNLCGSGSVYERFDGMLGGDITGIDAVVTSTFTASGGVYTFNPSALTDANVSLAVGVTDPATITLTNYYYAGLRLAGSSAIVQNVIFNNNSYSAWIESGSGSSTFMTSTSTGSLVADFRHDSVTTSTLSDVSFSPASTSFTSTGGFDVYYTSRIRVVDTDGNPLANINTSSTPASIGSTRSYGTTDTSGYTSSFSQLAHRINYASVSLTNSGKNPYTWTSGASSTYIASSTSASISSPFQTITLVASQRTIGFSSGSASGAESTGATSIRIEMSTTSLSDVTVDYAVTGGTATGSGTDYTLTSGTATIPAGDTYTTIPLTIIDDSAAESSETIIVTLSNPSGAALETTTFTYTITDNDSSSGGGGGGGGATSFSLPLPTPVNNSTISVVPPEVHVTFIEQINSDSSNNAPPTQESVSTPSTFVEPSSNSKSVAVSDAKAYKVTLLPEDIARIASFIEFGSSAETKALGSGERRALLRDVYDTLGRAIPASDLEKLAKGQIATTRNRDREIAQLPRVRQTFRTIFGHDPNFKDAKEDLAWNTLMYRIRFPRNLTKEKQGIVEFKATFKKAPSDPFQWAVVRVLGYVE